MKPKAFFLYPTIVFLCIGSLLRAQSAGESKYFIDVHKLEPGTFTYADVADAHEKDLMEQANHGVSFLTYWVDENAGYVYCLSEAKNAGDVHKTHETAHGLVPSNIFMVIAGEQANYSGNGKLFLDIHELGVGNVTASAVEAAHLKDLSVQEERNVNFINYWVDEASGKVFCLSEAPDQNAVIETHKHAHGLIPNHVLSVTQGQ